MRYRQITEHPGTGTVERLTIIPVLPDGRLGAIADDGAAAPDESVTLIHGRVGADEHWLTGAALRIPVEVAGFRGQRVHALAAEGLPKALHLIVWVEGDVRGDLGGRLADDGHATRRDAGEQPTRLHALPPGELRRRVSADRGIIPGGASPAWIVADVAASVATDTSEAYLADVQRLLTPAYLAAKTPQGGSGFSGDAGGWEARRGHIADAVHRSGTFLDLGCANGLLMESVHQWAADRGLEVEPYGVDISPGLVAEARRRLPHWAERIEVGNALTWKAAGERKFDVVYVLTDAAPTGARRDLVDHARSLVTRGGRLLVGHYVAQGGLEVHVGDQLLALGLPSPDGLVPYRGGQVPMLAWYDA